MADVRVLAGRHEAQKIHEHITVAYWIGETAEKPGYHMSQVHENFEDLARGLGYRVERIGAQEEAA